MAEPYRKKLIEVALPLEAINAASAHEKSIRHGHPSTLHLWWARRPLAACRAVLFASIVDDPSSRPDLFPTEEEQGAERHRLFRLIEELVKWENTTNETVLEMAREEIRKATDGNPPPVLDPFCGGGSIPLEAQRLGLEVYASDLNPVAVLITKALIEIPPKFAGKPPVNPESQAKLAHGATWRRAQGLAEDVRYYGQRMRDQAFMRIGHLYPEAKLPDGREVTVIAWLWARTVTCPNPVCRGEMPLVRSFWLGTKKGREVWVEPEVTRGEVTFRIRRGDGAPVEGTAGRSGARCLICGESVPLSYVRAEGRAQRMGTTLMAIAAEGKRGREYVEPNDLHVRTAHSAAPSWAPEQSIAHNPQYLSTPNYGLATFADLFTSRQLVSLGEFVDLLRETHTRVLEDSSDKDYADAVATYLAFVIDRSADYWSSVASWHSGPKMEAIRNTFARHAIPMTWDFSEANPFSESSGNWLNNLEWTVKALESVEPIAPASVDQLDAAMADPRVSGALICTDPPYYDNIGYSDLSDFFYVWLRRSLSSFYPSLFSTLVTPKTEELVANSYRFGGDKQEAREEFDRRLSGAVRNLRVAQAPEYPLTLFYAFRQTESSGRDGDSTPVSTGWDTMLTSLIGAGYSVDGTWPMRSELANRMVASGKNALASSILVVCRQRRADAPIATRREVVSALRSELPRALKQLQHGNIAPVDLAQAAIGPGMAVFSRYAKVLEADGTPMTVRSALALINQALDEILSEQEGDFDADTRFAVTWFEQHGFAEAPFGEADVLARAKDTSTGGLEEAGVLVSRAGKVRLLRREELPDDWDPVSDRRPTVWEATQHLAHRLEVRGEDHAADLLRRLGGLGETARELAYRLYTTCERRGWAQDALAYNALVVAWPEIARLVAGTPEAEAQQALGV